MSKLLSDLPIGSLVKDPNSTFLGSPIIWKIADKNHTGYPENSVTLITERSVAMRAFDAKEPNNSDIDGTRQMYGNNRYSVSNIRQWLNSDAEAGKWYVAQHSADQAPSGTDYVSCNAYSDDAGFLNGFSKNFKRALLETTLTVALNVETDGGGSETVTDKVFLASNAEVGYANQNNIVEGNLFPIFSDFSSRIAYVTAEGLADSDYKGKPENDTTSWQWLLRTPRTAVSAATCIVDYTNGSGFAYAYVGYVGVRPLCNLYSSVFVSDNPDENGIYTITFYPSGYVDAEGLEIALTKTKTYIDDSLANMTTEGFILLEASTDNVIDFNTLTEPGYYLIKNCSDGAGTTLNSGVETSTTSLSYTDVTLEVRKRIHSSGTSYIYQKRQITSGVSAYYRYYANSSWIDWTLLLTSADKISAGLLKSGMKCNTPTTDAHLANKKYVDDAIAEALSNISVSSSSKSGLETYFGW